MKHHISQERLKQVLDYNELTGAFVWKQKPAPRSNKVVGSVAGCVSRGYRVICVDR